jgi:hypothetical protein
MHKIAWIVASSWLLVSVGCGGGGGTGVDGSVDGCPFTLTVDSETYNALKCQLQGGPTAAAHLYQIDLSAQFNDTPGMIRSVEFTLRDDTDSTHDHAYTVGAGAMEPSIDATYVPTSLDPGFSTLSGAAEVGTGTFNVTNYDTVGRLFSGSYSITVKKGAEEKLITGMITNAPMFRAE